MPSIGPLELAIILVIVLLVFGPKRLPGLGKQLGTGMREFKESITGKDKDKDADAAADVAKAAEPQQLASAPAPAAPVATTPPAEAVAAPVEAPADDRPAGGA